MFHVKKPDANIAKIHYTIGKFCKKIEFMCLLHLLKWLFLSSDDIF
jgi:hypothetical protein